MTAVSGAGAAGGVRPASGDDLIATERRKYEKAHLTDAYRESSPGERIAPRVLDWIQELGAMSLTDYGCGTGSAMKVFADRGLNVRGVDIVAPPDPPGVVHEASLWAMGAEVPATDFAFSCDVLEHIPPAMVDACLRGIRGRARLGGFFQIATREDSIGAEIGEVLHLTIRPPEWWAEGVARHFAVERMWVDPGSKVRLWLRAE